VSAARRRLDELLAGRAVAGLTRAEDAELARLLPGLDDADETAFERTAAALLVALTEPADPMPASLRARLEQSAREFEGEPG